MEPFAELVYPIGLVEWRARHSAWDQDAAVGPDMLITVTVSVPSDVVSGTVDTIIITAASSVSPTLVEHVTDITLVPRARVYLPISLRN